MLLDAYKKTVYCSSVSHSIIHLTDFHSLKLIDFYSFYQPPHRTLAGTDISSDFKCTLMAFRKSYELICYSTNSVFSLAVTVIGQ